MRSLREWFASWFKRSESKIESAYPEHIDATLEEDYLSVVQFVVKKDMSVRTSVSWDDRYQTPEIAEALGIVLQFITNGGYDKLIAQSLVESTIVNPKTDIDFVQTVLDSWNNGDFLKLQQDMQQLPAISPLKTFGESNFGGTV